MAERPDAGGAAIGVAIAGEAATGAAVDVGALGEVCAVATVVAVVDGVVAGAALGDRPRLA